MAILRPNQLPPAILPLASTDLVVVDQGANGVNAADPQDVVDAAAPVASQAEAEAGADNTKRMTALRTKQSIASEVGVTLASAAQGALAATAVQPSRQVIAGSGLTGGGALSADVTLNVGAGTGISVAADTVGLDATTQSRLLIAGGTTSQVLQKASNTNYDVVWATVAAATAVSYAPQTLTSGEQLQARTNIGLSNVDNTSDANKPISTATQTALDLKLTSSLAVFGECRLTLSGGNLLLSRFNGRLLTINGAQQTIPSSGLTLAATSLTPGTLYYIYAFMSGPTMTLEASTTGHATDSTTGVEIKSGDATRTLVGMARPITGPAWADSITQRFVRSWFNRKPEAMRKAFTAIRSTSSTSLVEVNTEVRCEWLQWSDEVPTANIQGSTNISTSGIYTNTAIGWDGTADANTLNSTTSTTGVYYNCSTGAPKEGLSEGYHYATIMGSVSAAATGFWGSGVSGVFTSLSVSIG